MGQLAAVTKVQITGCMVVLALLALVSADLLNAISSQPCSEGGTDCYPWGAEGPVAGMSSYASKSNYLLRSFSQFTLLASAEAILIWNAVEDHPVTGLRRAAPFAALAAAALLNYV